VGRALHEFGTPTGRAYLDSLAVKPSCRWTERNAENAIESGGLTQQEVTQTLRQIEQIDARLAAAPAA